MLKYHMHNSFLHDPHMITHDNKTLIQCSTGKTTRKIKWSNMTVGKNNENSNDWEQASIEEDKQKYKSWKFFAEECRNIFTFIRPLIPIAANVVFVLNTINIILLPLLLRKCKTKQLLNKLQSKPHLKIPYYQFNGESLYGCWMTRDDVVPAATYSFRDEHILRR